MLTRLLACLAALSAFWLAAPLQAQESDHLAEIKRLQAVLTVINNELKADFDQIFMLQEAIKTNGRASLKVQGKSPDPVSWEAAAAEQRRAIQREEALNARLEALLARSASLDARKQPILDRLQALSAEPPPVVTRAETPAY